MDVTLEIFKISGTIPYSNIYKQVELFKQTDTYYNEKARKLERVKCNMDGD
jgi:hypothetical protein